MRIRPNSSQLSFVVQEALLFWLMVRGTYTGITYIMDTCTGQYTKYTEISVDKPVPIVDQYGLHWKYETVTRLRIWVSLYIKISVPEKKCSLLLDGYYRDLGCCRRRHALLHAPCASLLMRHTARGLYLSHETAFSLSRGPFWLSGSPCDAPVILCRTPSVASLSCPLRLF